MITLTDEGFTDYEGSNPSGTPSQELLSITSIREREELVFALLNSLPRSSLANIQRNIIPLLQFDVIGSLPDEVALLVYSFLPWQSLLTCSLVSRRWNTLTNDPTLWRDLCIERRWEWRNQPRVHKFSAPTAELLIDSDDEGMGDDEEDVAVEHMLEDDSGFSSMIADSSFASSLLYPYLSGPSSSHSLAYRSRAFIRHSAPSVLPSPETNKPNYKLLFKTHIRLQNRIRTSIYNLTTLQTRETPNSHTNTIYCLQLYTYPDTGRQVLFTGSKDRTVREWDLATRTVTRVIEGVHTSSVLTICVYNGMLVSGGSDQRVAVWHLDRDELITSIHDHEDSVLCVRFDDKRLVTCSKDRTVRTYLLPSLTPQYVLREHRAAVNAVAISSEYIVSASGDRSMRLWDAATGALLHTFENHHGRGIASIDYKPPYVLSGSSDKHLRLLDLTTSQGWATSPDYDTPPSAPSSSSDIVCETCGHNTTTASIVANNAGMRHRRRAHDDLVRSVALSSDFVVSGSYDFTVKVWDRKTGVLLADLSGGHTGRIFCVGFDYSKIVSCGEDQRICIWDFSHGIDTSFVKL